MTFSCHLFNKEFLLWLDGDIIFFNWILNNESFLVLFLFGIVGYIDLILLLFFLKLLILFFLVWVKSEDNVVVNNFKSFNLSSAKFIFNVLVFKLFKSSS